MLLRECLKKGIEILDAGNNETPALEAGVIMSHVLKKDRIWLHTHQDSEINSGDAEIFIENIRQRNKGKPLQYITGHQEFMSLDFIVDYGVLIPRGDTEILVESVLEEAKKSTDKLEILDIGTGSGCIAVSLAHYINNCHVTALDISEKALETAKINSINNKVDHKLNLIKSDLFESITGSFDIIVSNPPYIEPHVIEGLKAEVRDHEPLIALNGGTDGLDFYRTISEAAPGFLNTNGLLAFEIGYTQAEEVKGLMEKAFHSVTVLQDLSGNDRVLMGRLK